MDAALYKPFPQYGHRVLLYPHLVQDSRAARNHHLLQAASIPDATVVPVCFLRVAQIVFVPIRIRIHRVEWKNHKAWKHPLAAADEETNPQRDGSLTIRHHS